MHITAEGNTRPRWSGAARRSPYECHPSLEHMCTRRDVATEKGIAEAIHKLAIVTPFAYLLPTNLA